MLLSLGAVVSERTKQLLLLKKKKEILQFVVQTASIRKIRSEAAKDPLPAISSLPSWRVRKARDFQPLDRDGTLEIEKTFSIGRFRKAFVRLIALFVVLLVFFRIRSFVQE